MFLSGADNLLGCLGFEEDKHVPKTVVWEVILIFSATLPSLELLSCILLLQILIYLVMFVACLVRSPEYLARLQKSDKLSLT